MNAIAAVHRWPLVIITPSYRAGVRWAQNNGFKPHDERTGRIIFIGYGAGDRCRGVRGGTYVVVRPRAFDPQYLMWLAGLIEMLEAACGFRELYNWDDALDGAVHEALRLT